MSNEIDTVDKNYIRMLENLANSSFLYGFIIFIQYSIGVASYDSIMATFLLYCLLCLGVISLNKLRGFIQPSTGEVYTIHDRFRKKKPFTTPRRVGYAGNLGLVFETKSEITEKYIDDIGRKIRVCCFQTARLNERICECGRPVPSSVIEYIHSN